MTKYKLRHFFRGKLFQGATSVSDFSITACSQDLTLEESAHIFNTIWRASLAANDLSVQDSDEIFLLSNYDATQSIWTYIRPGFRRERGHLYPHFHCWIIPRRVLARSLTGNLSSLFTLAMQPPLVYEEYPERSNLPLAEFEPVGLDNDEELASLEYLLHYADATQKDDGITSDNSETLEDDRIARIVSRLLGDFEKVQESIVIRTSGKDMSSPTSQFTVLQSLLGLIPPSVRSEFTFALALPYSSLCEARVKFVNSSGEKQSDETLLFWSTLRLSRTRQLHLYADYLQPFIPHGARAVLEAVQEIENDLQVLPEPQKLWRAADLLSLVILWRTLRNTVDISEIESSQRLSMVPMFQAISNISLQDEHVTNLLQQILAEDEMHLALVDWVERMEKENLPTGDFHRGLEAILNGYSSYYGQVATNQVETQLRSGQPKRFKLVSRQPAELIHFNLRVGRLCEHVYITLIDEYLSLSMLSLISTLIPLAKNYPSAARWLFILGLVDSNSNPKRTLREHWNNPEINLQIVHPEIFYQGSSAFDPLTKEEALFFCEVIRIIVEKDNKVTLEKLAQLCVESFGKQPNTEEAISQFLFYLHRVTHAVLNTNTKETFRDKLWNSLKAVIRRTFKRRRKLTVMESASDHLFAWLGLLVAKDASSNSLRTSIIRGVMNDDIIDVLSFLPFKLQVEPLLELFTEKTWESALGENPRTMVQRK